MRTIIFAVGLVIQVGNCLAQAAEPPTDPSLASHFLVPMGVGAAVLKQRMPCELGCVQSAPESYYSANNPDLSQVGPDLSRVGTGQTSTGKR
jgi:hypothetical protein